MIPERDRSTHDSSPSFDKRSASCDDLPRNCLTRAIEYSLTDRDGVRTMALPMTRTFTAESLLQGMSLSSFGAVACQPGQRLDHEPKPERRDLANAGSPVSPR
jgi:hypothetical protein